MAKLKIIWGEPLRPSGPVPRNTTIEAHGFIERRDGWWDFFLESPENSYFRVPGRSIKQIEVLHKN